jgi:integrase
VGLSAEHVTALENVKLPDPRHDHARKLWLFSFYFAGMRVSDIFRLKWSDFQNYLQYYA